MPIRKMRGDFRHTKPKSPKKKKFQTGGGVQTTQTLMHQQPFMVGKNYLQQLLQRSGIDPAMLDRMRRQSMRNQAPFGVFDHPTALMASKVEKAKPARMAGKAGGKVCRGAGVVNRGKKTKYI